MNTVKTAIIGVGHQGKKRLHAISQVAELELVGVVDRKPKALENAQKQFALQFPSARWSGDVHDVLDRQDVELVIVATSSDQHADIAEKLLKAGKHVLVEKPLGCDLGESLRIADAALGAKGHLKIGFNYPYRNSARAAIAACREGLIGAVIHARATIGHAQFVGDASDRTLGFLKHSTSMEDLGIHAIDLARFFFFDEQPQKVVALETVGQLYADPMFDVSDVTQASFVYADGRFFTISSSFSEHRPWMGLRFEVFGRLGRIVFGMSPNTVELMIKQLGCDDNTTAEAAHLLHAEKIERALTKHGLPRPAESSTRLLCRDAPRLYYTQYSIDYGQEDVSLAAELSDLVRKIREDQRTPLYRDADDCVAAQTLIEAARRSVLKNGEAVQLAEVAPKTSVAM